ncbi:MAG: AAC(3)-I family aminoglycoside N-acetyltransferase [Blastocatellia bacterium]
MSIYYTRATIETLRELLKVFAEAFDDFESYQSAVPSDEYLNSLLDDRGFIPLVAIEDSRVIGGLAAYVLKKFEQERSEIYIYDLAVDDAYRRRGIATGLINKLKEIAKDIGSYVIFVQADHGDDPAIRLYESLGRREEVLHFDILPDK